MARDTQRAQAQSGHRGFLTAFFAVYTFEYMVTLTLIDKGISEQASGSWPLTLHYIDTALVMLGFLTFALVRKLPEGVWVRRALPLLSSAVYGISVLALFFLRLTWAYSVLAMCASLSLGVLGGMVYFCMATALADNPATGRVMASGGVLALLMQYLFQEFLDISMGLPIMLVLGFCAVLYLTYRRPWEWLEEDVLPYEAPDSGHSRMLARNMALICVIAVCLECIGAAYDRQMLLLNIRSGYEGFSLYAWPRLFAAVGYLLVGLLYDAGKGKLLPVTTLCAALLAVLNPVLSSSYALNLCIFYTFLGACVSYYNLAFWQIAPRTAWPELWAGMGRVVTNLASFLLLLAPLDRLSMAGAVALDVILFGVMLVCMAVSGALSFEREAAPQPQKPQPQRTVQSYCRLCGFTPRESEVFEKIVFSEDIGEKLADELQISRRMLQRYIASLYEKTGTKTKAGLTQHFLRYQMGTDAPGAAPQGEDVETIET